MTRSVLGAGLILAVLAVIPMAGAVERDAVATATKRAVASSTVKVNTKITYGPEKIFDGDPATGWCEGVKGDGEGQSVAIYLGDAKVMGGPQDVVFYITRGLQTDWGSYEKNGRPTRMRVELFADDKLLASKEGDTLHAFSEIALKNVPKASGALWFRVTILKVLPGTKWQDTCISEIRPAFAKANPHNAREFSARVCLLVNKPKTKETNRDLLKLVKTVKKEFINYDEMGEKQTRCDPKGLSILSEDDFQMWASEGGDGASIVRFRRKGIIWEMVKAGYFTAWD